MRSKPPGSSERQSALSFQQTTGIILFHNQTNMDIWDTTVVITSKSTLLLPSEKSEQYTEDLIVTTLCIVISRHVSSRRLRSRCALERLAESAEMRVGRPMPDALLFKTTLPLKICKVSATRDRGARLLRSKTNYPTSEREFGARWPAPSFAFPSTRSSSIRYTISSQEAGNALFVGDHLRSNGSPARLFLNYAIKMN
ncbi:hypothetical protein EVAR_8008_1 [Eumeta japonica]|uniref:Uncharacterized protein n=1 Tax=Eumeta variegata TaxID=151549 RepID=A0A4C1TI34_EUMVA|nr:hypothetical protein EVAR_8008_1 [Eumeta japonica]